MSVRRSCGRNAASAYDARDMTGAPRERRTDATALAPLNRAPEVLAAFPRKPLFLCDCTLREGEQSAGAAFSLRDKIRVAHLLDEVGIRQIQLGYPGISQEDAEIARAIAAEGLGADIECIAMIHVPDWKRHIEATVAAGPDIVSMQYGTSDIRLEKVLKVSRAEALETIVAAVRYARELGARTVSFSPTDTTRTDLDFLVDIARALADAGCDRMRIADSMGAIHPTAFRFMVQSVREALPERVLLGVHTHNDFGLALANVCAGLEAGADFLDGVVNGLGERAGNTSLDELVMVTKHLYGYDVDVDEGRLVELARLVEEMSGRPIPSGKPVVGSNAFAHQLDNHIRGVSLDPAVYEPYPPALVGNERRFPLGRLSGPYAVRLKLRTYGVPEDGLDIDALGRQVRRLAEERKGDLGDDEFLALVRHVQVATPAG